MSDMEMMVIHVDVGIGERVRVIREALAHRISTANTLNHTIEHVIVDKLVIYYILPIVCFLSSTGL